MKQSMFNKINFLRVPPGNLEIFEEHRIDPNANGRIKKRNEVPDRPE